MKTKTFGVLITALLILSSISVVFITFITDTHDNFEENVTVKSEGITNTVITVNDLKLNPSGQCEYTINLVCAASGDFDVTLDYMETENGGMKSFVYVNVSADGETVYNGTLSELLDTETKINFKAYLTAKQPVLIKIIYEMPENVGNEAQGTYSDFKINLSIVKN